MKKAAQLIAAQGFTERCGFWELFHDPSYSWRFVSAGMLIHHQKARFERAPLHLRLPVRIPSNAPTKSAFTISPPLPFLLRPLGSPQSAWHYWGRIVATVGQPCMPSRISDAHSRGAKNRAERERASRPQSSLNVAASVHRPRGVSGM